MSSHSTVLASGNLGSSRRTVTGILGQLALAGLDEDETLAILQQIGLPAAAIEDPEFPLSLQQELQALALVLPRLESGRDGITGFAIDTFSRIGINHYGVLGLAMQHAPTTLQALGFFLDHPELSWGHSRIVLRREGEHLLLDFDMHPPALPTGEALRCYCVVRDLICVYRLIADLLGADSAPLALSLPFPAPAPPFDARHHLPCPVTFDAPTATLCYPATVIDSTPVHASAAVFKRYAHLTRQFSRVLADDAPVSERVTRLLWAYTPPPDREQVAAMLAMSARTLARRLRAEGQSFAALLREVQRERACNLLRHTRLPLSVIAERLGYADPAAFTRAFHSWTGSPPSRWRRQAEEVT